MEIKMKNLLLTVLFSGLSLTAFAAESKTEKACFNVQGMTCRTCTLTVKTAVRKLKGIQSVSASVSDKNATVVFDPNLTNKKEIEDKIDLVGYQASLKECKK
jgi:copper chaperone CopZ